jgi:hypothetical protein
MLEKKSWPLGGIFELPTWFIIGGSKGVALISFILNIKKDFDYSRVKNGLLPRIRTFREITFFMLCVTRIFKSYFECLSLVTLN